MLCKITMRTPLIAVLVWILCNLNYGECAIRGAGRSGNEGAGNLPQQFKVSFAPEPTSVYVSWVTVGTRNWINANPYCVYQSDGTNITRYANATVATYVDGGCGYWCVPWNGQVFTAKLDDVAFSPWRTYYSCGDDRGFSEIYNFTGSTARSSEYVRLAVFGDVGSYSDSLQVRDKIIGYNYNTVIQAGDISYANGNQTRWDVYGLDWEPLFASTITQVLPGNHDGEWIYGNNYTDKPEGGGDSGVSYSVRFHGPGPNVTFNSVHTGVMFSNAFYWSINIGTVHFTAVSGLLNFSSDSTQYTWLMNDLLSVNRTVTPWVIVSLHYPLYCTMGDCFCNYTAGSNCGSTTIGLKAITSRFMKDALEPLLVNNHVDLVITGHEHAYERTYPVNNFVVTSYNSTDYINPSAPIHVMIGTGGAESDYEWKPRGAEFTNFSAVRTDVYPVKYEPFGWLELESESNYLTGTYYNLKINGIYDRFTITRN